MCKIVYEGRNPRNRYFTYIFSCLIHGVCFGWWNGSVISCPVAKGGHFFLNCPTGEFAVLAVRQGGGDKR